jgi:hypothetical protein
MTLNGYPKVLFFGMRASRAPNLDPEQQDKQNQSSNDPKLSPFLGQQACYR